MTYKELWQRLTKAYDEGEAKAIARMVYEVRYGLTLSDIYLGKDVQLSIDCQAELEAIAKRLLHSEPIQYILGYADFCGRSFIVNNHVLIPRPETEELCRWILAAVQPDAHILDIGTGSGCIAITLAAERPETEVTAWDISGEALKVAGENARHVNVHVSFAQVDILQSFHLPPSSFHLIVSNPPYICNKERVKMEANVLEHEPHTALFVPDDDPLQFYRAIAQYAQVSLTEGGWLYFEINPLYAASLRDMLCTMRFSHIEIKEDAYGKQRMIRAQKRNK